MANNKSIVLPPYINGKNYEKSLYLQDDFRSFVHSTRINIVELIYLFQNDLDKTIEESLTNIISVFDDCVTKLVKNYLVADKFSIIQDFYSENTEKLKTVKDTILKQMYPTVENICGSFSNENVDCKSLFQEFYEENKKLEINFETVKIIVPPKSYNTQLSESECEDYDKFVAVVNSIICLRNLVKFSADFSEKSRELQDKEKEANAKEKQEYFEKLIEANNKLTKAQNDLKIANDEIKNLKKIKRQLDEKIDGLNDENEQLIEKNEQLKEKTQKMQKEINNLLSENKKLKKEDDNKKETSNDLVKKLEELENKKEAFEEERQLTQERIHQLHTENKKLKENIDELHSENEKLKEDIDEYVKHKSEYEKLIAENRNLREQLNIRNSRDAPENHNNDQTGLSPLINGQDVETNPKSFYEKYCNIF